MTPAEWFALLESRAPALRAAGVLEISIDGVAIKLAPAPLAGPEPRAAAQTEAEPDDPLNNPGLYADGIVPGYVLEPEGGDA